MLESIKQTVLQIGDFLRNVADWFVDFIEDLVFFVTELAKSVSTVQNLLGEIFPSSLVAAFVALLTIVVILRILGRD